MFYLLRNVVIKFVIILVGVNNLIRFVNKIFYIFLLIKYFFKCVKIFYLILKNIMKFNKLY